MYVSVNGNTDGKMPKKSSTKTTTAENVEPSSSDQGRRSSKRTKKIVTSDETLIAKENKLDKKSKSIVIAENPIKLEPEESDKTQISTVLKTKTNKVLNLTTMVSDLCGQFKNRFLPRHYRSQIVALNIPKLVPIPLSWSNVNTPRIMALEWHPRKPNMLLVGGKHGEVHLVSDFEHCLPAAEKWPGSRNEPLREVSGPGGGLTGINFDVFDDNVYYTCSIDGMVASADATRPHHHNELFRTTHRRDACLDHWFTAMDPYPGGKLLYVGDNKGSLHIMPVDGKGKIMVRKLHKSKIHSVEFNPRDSNVFLTCSIDRMVKLWDIRHVSKEIPLKIIDFNEQVNSALQCASFSKVNGGTFVVTDQKESIFVYNSGSYQLERTIKHFNHTFQHLTPIRTDWHPSADILIVGRFKGGDKSNSNQIDFIDVHTGKYVYSIEPEGDMMGIKSLNKFNCLGDTMASSLGQKLVVWKLDGFIDGLREKCRQQPGGSDPFDDMDDGRGRGSGKRKRPTKSKDVKTRKKL